MPRCFVVLIIALATGRALAKDVKAAVSLRYSCSDKPFLSVSVSTQHRDSFPDVQLRLLDPEGGSVSSDSKHKEIPKSQAGKVIEMPGHAAISRVVAAEICEAVQGDYALLVSEYADGQYRLSVAAEFGTGEAMSSWILSRQGQTCTFRFRVRMGPQVSVRWLSPDHVQTFSPDPTCELATTH